MGSPIVTVDGGGDGDATLPQSFSVSASSSAVTTAMRVTDVASGTASIVLRYSSTETTHIQTCVMSRTAGTVNDGNWSCTINFPALAATGSWVPTLEVFDSAANRRFYSRRSTDGYMCYFNSSTATTACVDSGETELILR